MELIIFKNINLKYYNQSSKLLFFELNSKFKPPILIDYYKTIFNNIGHSKVRFLESFSFESIFSTAEKLVHFGWKKEAIPVTQSKKSYLARFFE